MPYFDMKTQYKTFYSNLRSYYKYLLPIYSKYAIYYFNLSYDHFHFKVKTLI